MELPQPGNYQPLQGYLFAATNNPSGINAAWAWTQTGGTGTGVTICDLEYSWNYNHADVTKLFGSQINTNVADPFGNNNHGTAVAGELVSDNNGWGTTGICYGSNLKTCGTYYGTPTPSWNVPGALAVAIANLVAGDIILLEQQWDYSPTSAGLYVPVEWWGSTSPSAQYNNSVYSAIVTAVANGIHVVEAGGNGSVNTGSLSWYGNSGAIIVGAGGATPTNDRQRLSFSSYGPRFNLQGWGEQVMTTGYGTYYSGSGVNYYYTSTFNGTSSASPIVTGALACVEGFWYANVSTTPPTPAYMITQLANYGTPQVFGLAGNIGPRPNIQASIQNLPVPLDYGDAPDPAYPTLLASNGARHTNTGLILGNTIDVELNGFQSPTAMGDDNNILDDEDGVWWNCNFVPGQTATLQVVASGAGFLQGWIDYNKNGSWAEVGEQVFTNIMLAAGMNYLNIPVPAGAMVGTTFARFRFSSQINLMYFGPATDGEVEDYQVTIDPVMPMDYGDAPDPTYPTLAGSNGPRHGMGPPAGIFLGSLVDYEINGQPNVFASGDDINLLPCDEDGVVFPGVMIPGQPGRIQVTVSIPGFLLQGWIDFNANGSFADPGEQILMNYAPPTPIFPVVFMVPPTAQPGLTYARFRYSAIPNLSYTGCATDGEVEDYAIYIGEYDFGDAPDPTYPTLNASNGAVHKYTGLMLGGLWDAEPNGQPNATATGDDINPSGSNDEDGVWWACNFVPGQTNTVRVTVNGAGFLNAWIDYNIDGDWADPGEQVFTSLPLTNGTTDLTVTVPPNALMGNTFARFRFSSIQQLGYTGSAPDGEVEDYMLQIQSEQPMDYGDAPDPTFPTLALSNGARHMNDPTTPFFLGNQIDWEPDGLPSPNAMGDDMNNMPDEDGIVFTTPLNPGLPATITVTANIGQGLLQGWIDFNRDGDWDDAFEQVFNNILLAAGTQQFTVPVPPGASLGNAFARFRYSSMVNLPYFGCAPDGEVEDYMTLIEEPQTLSDFGDAPEGSLAYPFTNVNGNFPTCKNVGPSGWIEHLSTIVFFGPGADIEPDGNAGMCPVFPPNSYDQDECMNDGDAGLLMPSSFTLLGQPVGILPCPQAPAPTPLQQACKWAQWGINIDILVNNMNQTPAFVNILMDWNQDGQWGGNSVCPGGATVPEHVLQNFLIPPGFAGPLSTLGPPSLLLGPNQDFLWTRFTLTDQPVAAQNWDGSGLFDFGETEDYLMFALPRDPVPDSLFVQNVTLTNDTCFEAVNKITVAGNGTTVTIQTGANVHFISSGRILILPHTTVQYGAGMHAYITTDGNYCNLIRNPLMAVSEEVRPDNHEGPSVVKSAFRVFPNPTTGNLTIETGDTDTAAPANVELYGLMGNLILRQSFEGQDRYEISLTLQPPGVYILRVISGSDAWIVKVVKQ